MYELNNSEMNAKKNNLLDRTDIHNALLNEEDVLNEILINIEVIPGGRKYPVKINADDEELIREATKQLRIKIISYNQSYSEAETISNYDIMTMVAIDIATSLLRLERNKNMEPFVEKIQQLNYKLGNYLKEQ